MYSALIENEVTLHQYISDACQTVCCRHGTFESVRQSCWSDMLYHTEHDPFSSAWLWVVFPMFYHWATNGELSFFCCSLL